jgi:hypothetical protein
MMPRLPGRWRWMPACLVMLLAVACSAGAQVAYTPPFAPFTLTVSVDQHGHVSVSASVSDTIVTEVGEFSVGGGVSADLAQQNQGTVVDFRSGKTDKDYMIRTGRELHFQARGHIVETITQNLVVITVSPGTAFSIAVSGTPPPPAPKPDRSCGGDATHVVRLPVLNLGPLGTFDSVDQVRAKLRSICITSTVLKVIHGADYHEPGGQDEGQYTFEHNGIWRPWPAGSVQEVDIPCDRHMFFIFWHNYDYIDVTFDSYAGMFGGPWLDLHTCERPNDAHEPPGETDKPGTLAVVRSDKPAIIYFLDGS